MAPTLPPVVRCFFPGPAALARTARVAGLPGLVWLDRARPASDQPSGGGTSLLAAAPAETWRGYSEADWEAFSGAWARRSAAEPGAVAVGWVEYDGPFQFAVYRQPAFYEHSLQPDGGKKEDRGTWRFPGGQPAWWEAVANRAAATTREDMGDDDDHDADLTPPVLTFRAERTAAEFCRRVRRAQEHIAAGDVYQVNLAHRFAAPWPPPTMRYGMGTGPADPFALYLRLRRVSPAPEAAFLDFPGRTVLCASPELFLDLDGRRVRTRPIKGTCARGADPRTDAAAARELLASAKERAELLMITDLLRNDLGRLCDFGAVWVPELLRLERHAQVFHLVSTVEGRLRAGITHPAVLRACLPGGSITGAPKRRACEIIAELEAPTPRGLYTGALGYFSAVGHSRFNVVIRTLIIEGGEAHFHVGAGIVADSVPALEHAETLHKAAGILRACGGDGDGGAQEENFGTTTGFGAPVATRARRSSAPCGPSPRRFRASRRVG